MAVPRPLAQAREPARLGAQVVVVGDAARLGVPDGARVQVAA